MIKSFIKNNWEEYVRYMPEDNDTLIGMPYPYIVPSPDKRLQEMYYWDTYFTSKGLYLSGREDLAKNCTDDMLFMVEKYGFMPNGNRTYYLSQSQPPVLSLMADDVYEYTKDTEWLDKAYSILKKEYSFWMTERITETGLNTYKCNRVSENDAENHYRSICKRLNYKVPMNDHVLFAKCFLSDCESGWDFTPRCFMVQNTSIYVDLNSLLYMFEKNMQKFAEVLDKASEIKAWSEKASKRKMLMTDILWNKTAFFDYNYNAKEHSRVFSAASFYPLWAGLADFRQAAATVDKLSELECEYGIAACAKNDSPAEFQWDYPTGWAPLHFAVIRGLMQYGYTQDAVRIAKKYVDATEKMFENTGKLWEKYNVLTGENKTTADYQPREMLGWSAGVYLYAKDFLEKQD